MVGAGLRRPVVEQDLLVRMTQVEQPPGLLIEQVEVQTLAPKLGDAALQLAPLLGERGDLGMRFLSTSAERSIHPSSPRSPCTLW